MRVALESAAPKGQGVWDFDATSSKSELRPGPRIPLDLAWSTEYFAFPAKMS